ncbi:hypothetical protein TRAPUB_8065, partial [Trametes pubescens]
SEVKAGDSPWAPFQDKEEWQLAHWLVTSGLMQSSIEKYLKLSIMNYMISEKVNALLLSAER